MLPNQMYNSQFFDPLELFHSDIYTSSWNPSFISLPDHIFVLILLLLHWLLFTSLVFALFFITYSAESPVSWFSKLFIYKKTTQKFNHSLCLFPECHSHITNKNLLNVLVVLSILTFLTTSESIILFHSSY